MARLPRIPTSGAVTSALTSTTSALTSTLSKRAAARAATRAAAQLHPDTGFDARKLLARQALPAAVFLVLAWLLWDRIQGLDTASIAAALATVGPLQWLMGLALTGVSFWALGRYDAVVHRMTDTGIDDREAVRTGATAIAVAQTVGMGAISGAFVRWRMLPSLSLIEATRVSVIVSLSFLAGWAVLAALAVLAVPLPLPGGRALAVTVALAVLLAAATLALLSLIRPARLARLPIPSLKAMGTILGLAAVDTIAAGLVLFVLLPDGLAIAPIPLVAAYLLALGAGLVLTTPGGVGPFEVALIALLPGLAAAPTAAPIAPEPVLAAIIAYRALYYALPAVLGALILLRGPTVQGARQGAAPAPRPSLDPLPTAPNLPFLVDAVITAAPRAEAALLRHGRLGLLRDAQGRPAAMATRTGQSLLVLSDPLRPVSDARAFLHDIAHAARARLLTPVLYKSGARTAVAARRLGWAVLPISREAWIDTASYSADGAARRQLRRKLRKAESAGLTITEVCPDLPHPLPLAEMDALAAEWATARGGERGFSMGTWNPDTLAWARVFLARDADHRLLGFITVHVNPAEHTLDLMRSADAAPDGMMYLLVNTAVEAARRDGVARFSLAAVPVGEQDHEPRAIGALRGALDQLSGAAGLRQFKSAFAPRWETLYLAAPSRPGLVAGAADVAREIARPPGR